jgi:DNA-directed RNA polymerase specialized sigma24 family protein
MNDSEIQLKKSAHNGDVTAFEKLIEPYMKLVFQIAFKACGNKRDASIIAQRAFVTVFDQIMAEDFKGDIKIHILKTVMDLCRRRETANVNTGSSIDNGKILLHV